MYLSGNLIYQSSVLRITNVTVSLQSKTPSRQQVANSFFKVRR